jgi:hypothetical protein
MQGLSRLSPSWFPQLMLERAPAVLPLVRKNCHAGNLIFRGS